ncbi:hypothetical protein BACI9J_130307 [Bacillus altitudinis]|nr:hypothetical protein BACI9J_130307 [Bacillus altitudinis]
MLKWYKPIYFININEKQLPEDFQYLEQNSVSLMLKHAI